MQVHFESLDSVLTRAQVAVIADILSIEDDRNDPIWRVLILQASVVTTIFGEAIRAPTLHCQYEQGLPHRRGEMAVSPLASGSGIEFNVIPGDRVVLLIARAPTESGNCEVLRIEPLENEALLKRRKGQP
jgi:hypothetical protein